MTFSIIQDKWADSDNQNAADISSLIRTNQACKASETNSLSDEAFILSRNLSISETTSDFHKMSFRILQQWQNKLNVNNSDKTFKDFDENLKKNNEDDEEIDLTLKTDDLNSLISITNHTSLLINLIIS